ncbi:hypothetical protein ACFB49_30150 [Sphingomonas sp. DBB INV C78]|uniref:limonene-1,2-epoxide hydrolase family protein n=1 Tax=Sphingomonas sp. DBB INV C78 TaxID=3349434 RepID=UPI0036D405C1
MSNIPTVIAFCEAWKSRDADRIAALVSEDCFYHNVPMEPVVGRAAIAEFIRGFLGDASSVEFEMLTIAEAADGTVLTERVDRFVTAAGKVALPVMGSFKLKDGLIARWLDYFDMGQFAPQPAE